MRRKPLGKKAAGTSSSSSKALANKPHRARVFAVHGAARRAAVSRQLPAVENKHTLERGHAITYALRPVLCGKPGCARHHGPYWYAYWTAGGRVRSVYIGKQFRKVEDKCPEALRAGERF